MTNKIKFLPVLLILAAAFVFSSCGEGSSDRLTVEEIGALEDYVMSSYFILRGDSTLPESRAAWNVYTTELTFPAGDTPTTAEKQNFPEKGQRTKVTITKHPSLADIYLVENVTTYPNREDVLKQTTESYYVKNITSGDDTALEYNTNDLLWDIDLDSQDFNKRIKFETEYMNGTIRYEIVEATTTEDLMTYAAFDINGPLTFPAPNDGESWSPTAAAANYSSMVTYQQEEGNALDFWSDYKIVIGTRYYTEHGTDPSKPTKTSVSYEKIIERKVADSDLETRIDAFFQRLFSDDTTAIAYPGETLAETVIRYEILPNNKKTVKTQTQIFDSNDSASVVTFTANYAEDENGVVISSGAPVAVY